MLVLWSYERIIKEMGAFEAASGYQKWNNRGNGWEHGRWKRSRNLLFLGFLYYFSFNVRKLLWIFFFFFSTRDIFCFYLFHRRPALDFIRPLTTHYRKWLEFEKQARPEISTKMYRIAIVEFTFRPETTSRPLIRQSSRLYFSHATSLWRLRNEKNFSFFIFSIHYSQLGENGVVKFHTEQPEATYHSDFAHSSPATIYSPSMHASPHWFSTVSLLGRFEQKIARGNSQFRGIFVALFSSSKYLKVNLNEIAI